MNEHYLEMLEQMPLVAILRGIKPSEIINVADALIDSGFKAIEVPLNSPEAIKSIELLAVKYAKLALVGAGTVLTPEDVIAVKKAGGSLIVSPNMDTSVIKTAIQYHMIVLPGVATPTEAFAAVEAGAHGLKLFPAETFGPRYIAAIKAVLPKGTKVYAVGGVDADNLPEWLNASADGAGFGSCLYKPGIKAGDIKQRAQELVKAYQAFRQH